MHEIVRGTNLPLSIIIIGLGSEDFQDMVKLDADDVPLESYIDKKKMENDIV